MNTSQIYIAAAIVALAIIAFLVLFTGRNRKETRLSRLAGLAFACVLAGLLFGSNELIGYSLMGAGVLLAVIDMYNKSKAK